MLTAIKNFFTLSPPKADKPASEEDKASSELLRGVLRYSETKLKGGEASPVDTNDYRKAMTMFRGWECPKLRGICYALKEVGFVPRSYEGYASLWHPLSGVIARVSGDPYNVANGIFGVVFTSTAYPNLVSPVGFSLHDIAEADYIDLTLKQLEHIKEMIRWQDKKRR